MADLKLHRLPDRVPVKLTITVEPDLHKALLIYADLYRETYAQEEPVQTLIPYMLREFLDADRGFAQAAIARSANGAAAVSSPRRRTARRRTATEIPSTAS
ncbi:MAG: DUF2274 domain-containing protein [Pseudomonadota bacterium]|nr:DUF2274 domain-containing protein [Pseudomonadota bacterium]